MRAQFLAFLFFGVLCSSAYFSPFLLFSPHSQLLIERLHCMIATSCHCCSAVLAVCLWTIELETGNDNHTIELSSSLLLFGPNPTTFRGSASSLPPSLTLPEMLRCTVAERPSDVCEYVCLCVYHVLLEGCLVLLDDIPSIHTDTQMHIHWMAIPDAA